MLSNDDLDRINTPGRNPYADHIGIRFEHLDPERGRAYVDIRPEHFHPGGIVHGGVGFSLIDTCMAHTVLAGLDNHQNCSTIEVKISYLAAVMEGRITAEATVIRRGRRICFLEGRIDHGEKRIATASATFAIL